MTAKQLETERRYRYEEYLGNLCVWGVPTREQHNLAVDAAALATQRLRKDTGIVARLREFRESL